MAGPSILVVDDDAPVLLTLKATLEMHGYLVTAAVNGNENVPHEYVDYQVEPFASAHAATPASGITAGKRQRATGRQ